MICCFPFSFIEDRIIQEITKALGPIAVYCPTALMVPAHMLAWSQKGLLDLKYPQELNAEQLARAVAEFRAWADLHQGNITDMAGFFKSRAGRPPLVDETSPTQLGDQIRQYGRQTSPQPNQGLFQSALFLAMAQEFDQQNDMAAREMGSVQAMEKAMMASLSGDEEELNTEGMMAGSADQNLTPADAGAHMTAQRVQAWARVAGMDHRPFLLYATTSPAVWDYILEKFSQVQGPWCWDLGSTENKDPAPPMDIAADLKALSVATDQGAPAPDFRRTASAETSRGRLTVYRLTGIRPRAFPAMVAGGGAPEPPPDSSDLDSANTLIGLIESPAEW